MIIEFFFDWLAFDCNPTFTPDGKPWLDQDREFWRCVMYVHDLFRWAEHRAENPTLQIKRSDLSLADL